MGKLIINKIEMKEIILAIIFVIIIKTVSKLLGFENAVILALAIIYGTQK